MKKVRFLPLILALSLPLAGCSFEDLLFWKKNNQDQPSDQQPAEKTVTGILFVHVPSQIEIRETLDPKTVSLDLSYSDGTSGQGVADRISLDTATTGTKEGIAFYGTLYKTFSIEVVEEETPPVDKTVTSITKVYAPSTIKKGEILAPSEVSLGVVYSNTSTGYEKAERISLDTSSVGVKEGTAYLGELSMTFEIEVVEEAAGEKTFDELKNSVIQNHNYSLDVESYYKNFPEERYDGQMYNISNKAFYGTDPEYLSLWDSGYIKVKDQGIAKFYWSLANQQVILDYFVASNPDRTIYEIHSYLVEFLLESTLTKVSDTHYTSSNQELISMMANYSGLELSYISNPDHLDILQVGDSLKIELTLTANYYDPETLDPVQNEPVYVGITIKNIGSTHNSVIESFVEDESKKVADPAYWDAQAQSDFNDYFNEYIPPFPTGATYSFSEFAEWDGYDQKHYIKCQDLASGDLRTSYGAQLEAQGFALDNGVYRKTVENEDHTLASIYEAKMTYYDPSAGYRGHTYGYYYKGGVFQIEYTMYTQMLESVTSIEKLNAYVATTAAKDIVPAFPEAFNDAQVSKFDDHTSTINQLYPNSVLFATSSTGLFRIHIASFEDARTFYAQLLLNADEKGFKYIASSNGTTSIQDDADSLIRITDMISATKESYEAVGYLQCQIYIRNNYTEYFTVDVYKDDGVESKTIISPSNYYKVEEGTKVTFSFVIADGYELDKITSNVEGLVITKDSVGENQYYFLMPAHNVSINISTLSKAAEEGLEYDREYAVFVGRTDNQQYYERPTDQGSNKLHFIFKSDGTGSFTYTWYNQSGGVNSGPYTVTFTYTLIDGAFMITCVDGSNNALFGNFRLFMSGDAGNYNETGTFDSGEIIITLSNGKSESPVYKEVKLK